jgi:2-polyprenyl-3-methyl-5-hydroxy-6-metoxy-1,4-benzoquinol methylase
MPVTVCRICGHEFFKEPLLHFENMPKAAQKFPDADSLENDTKGELTVCQCSSCGLVQLSNDPVPYFREVIRAAAVSGELSTLKRKQFAHFLRKNALIGKKIIEIGCGRGEFMSLLRPMNVDIYGLEYSAAAVATCVRNGLKVSRGYLGRRAVLLENAPFDAFLLLMFLEHMPDPNSALKGIWCNLKDGAIGLVEVPNFDMLLRQKLFTEFISDHLLYFTKETLQIALNSNGFEVLEQNELRDDYVISAIVKKRQRLDLTSFYGFQTKIQAELDAYIGRFKAKRVAIWGAGHQALAIIALTKIAGKIKYVVDSATFKQGKFTPATHVPVVAPDALRSDPVDAVIVMAASYSDEVVKILQKQYNRNIQISVMKNHGLEIVGNSQSA